MQKKMDDVSSIITDCMSSIYDYVSTKKKRISLEGYDIHVADDGGYVGLAYEISSEQIRDDYAEVSLWIEHPNTEEVTVYSLFDLPNGVALTLCETMAEIMA